MQPKGGGLSTPWEGGQPQGQTRPCLVASWIHRSLAEWPPFPANNTEALGVGGSAPTLSVRSAQETDGVMRGHTPSPSHASREGTYLQGPASPLTVFVVGGTLESWGRDPLTSDLRVTPERRDCLP